MFRELGLFVCGIAIALQGLEFYDDPWVMEDFQRSAREMGKSGKLLLVLLDITVAYGGLFAFLLILAGFFMMNNLRVAVKFSLFALSVYFLVRYPLLLVFKDKFGGSRVILGIAHYVLHIFTLIFIWQQPDSVYKKSVHTQTTTH